MWKLVVNVVNESLKIYCTEEAGLLSSNKWIEVQETIEGRAVETRSYVTDNFASVINQLCKPLVADCCVDAGIFQEQGPLIADEIQALIRSLPKTVVTLSLANNHTLKNASIEQVTEILPAIPQSVTRLVLSELNLGRFSSDELSSALQKWVPHSKVKSVSLDNNSFTDFTPLFQFMLAASDLSELNVLNNPFTSFLSVLRAAFDNPDQCKDRFLYVDKIKANTPDCLVFVPNLLDPQKQYDHFEMFVMKTIISDTDQNQLIDWQGDRVPLRYLKLLFDLQCDMQLQVRMYQDTLNIVAQNASRSDLMSYQYLLADINRNSRSNPCSNYFNDLEAIPHKSAEDVDAHSPPAWQIPAEYAIVLIEQCLSLKVLRGVAVIASRANLSDIAVRKKIYGLFLGRPLTEEDSIPDENWFRNAPNVFAGDQQTSHSEEDCTSSEESDESCSDDEAAHPANTGKAAVGNDNGQHFFQHPKPLF